MQEAEEYNFETNVDNVTDNKVDENLIGQYTESGSLYGLDG